MKDRAKHEEGRRAAPLLSLGAGQAAEPRIFRAARPKEAPGRPERLRRSRSHWPADEQAASALAGDREARWREPAAIAADEWRPLIDPWTVLSGIRRSGRLIAAAAIAGALTGVMIALSTPKRYEAYADLLVDPRDIRLVDRELVSTSLSMEAALAIIENHTRLLTSSKVVDRVVEELNLTLDPEFNGRDGGFGLRSFVAELRMLLSRGDDSPGDGRDHAIAVRNVLERLSVSREGKTFVVSVAATTKSAEKSALIVNRVVDVFLEESGRLMADTAGRAASELGAKLEELRAGVEEAERRVETFKAENDLIDARGHLIGDDEIVALNQQLAAARARTIEVGARARSVRAASAASILDGGLPEGVNSGAITELRAQYAALTREASRLAATVGSLHPRQRTIEAQLEEARGQIRDELGRIVAAIQVELRRAVEQEQQLAQRLADLKARQVDVSAGMVTLRELEREAASRRAVYESYLLRARETGEQQDLNMANISVLSRADPPLDPTGPSRASISIAGLVSGLMLGLAAAGLRGAVDGLRSGAGPTARRGAAPARRLRREPDPDDGDDGPEDDGPPDRDPDRRHFRGRIEAGTGEAAAIPAHPARASGSVAESPAPPAPAQGAQPSLAYGFWPAPYGAMPPWAYAPAYAVLPQPVPFLQPVPSGVAFPAGLAPQPDRAPPAPAAPARSDDADPYVEIRDGLREVRGALHDLASRRARRRA